MTEIHTEPDRIPSKLIAATVIVTVIAIAASALVVWLLASRIAHGGGRSDFEQPVMEPPADSFSIESRHELRRADQRHRLDQWQWANPEHTRVLTPINTAIDRYLAEGQR